MAAINTFGNSFGSSSGNASGNPAPEIHRAVSMLVDMLEIGVRDGFLPAADSFPHIPELTLQAKTVCMKTYYDVSRWNDTKNPEKYSAHRLIRSVNRMCFYAGMGAVYLWNSDWDRLKRKGIFESLSAPCGAFYLDEYVLHLAGADFGSREGSRIDRHCCKVLESMEQYMTEQTNEQKLFEQMQECMKVMYLYGMVIGMNRIGLC